MKKIILFIPLFALLMFSALAPVWGEGVATKVPVMVKSLGASTGGGEIWLTNGDITQMKGRTSTGSHEIYITSTTVPDYVTTSTSEYSTMINWKTGDSVAHYHQLWEYEVGEEVVGTFSGEYILKGTGAYITPSGIPVPYMRLEGHVILQGDGIFEGWTLMLDSEATRPARSVYEGVLLIR